jgi:hypothetical protein
LSDLIEKGYQCIALLGGRFLNYIRGIIRASNLIQSRRSPGGKAKTS